MRRNEHKVVASGVIGQFNHEWQIVFRDGIRHHAEWYDLFVKSPSIEGKEMWDRFGSYNSVVEALAALVDEFSE